MKSKVVAYSCQACAISVALCLRQATVIAVTMLALPS